MVGGCGGGVGGGGWREAVEPEKGEAVSSGRVIKKGGRKRTHDGGGGWGGGFGIAFLFLELVSVKEKRRFFFIFFR